MDDNERGALSEVEEELELEQTTTLSALVEEVKQEETAGEGATSPVGPSATISP